MRFYIGDFGNVLVTFTDEDDTAIDLTGRTTEWLFENRDGTSPTPGTINGVTVAPATNGQVNFDMPTALTIAKAKFTTIMRILEGGVLIKSSVLPIQVDVDSISGS